MKSNSPTAQRPRQVAIYGKGGIGKSTISSNLSAAAALSGWRVLQIGCDPKQDSTRLLLEGRRVRPVLEYTRHTLPTQRRLEDVLHQGFSGVTCIEAGGPEPGVGCAGRGIITTFNWLAQLGFKKEAFDLIIYDVLGDVVCGGFAVPLREDYADVVYIVTSGEYMPIYAANNILRGVKSFHDGRPRLAGLLVNGRGIEGNTDFLNRFAREIDLPIKERIPSSPVFREAEAAGQTVMEYAPDTPLASIFRRLAREITSGIALHPARPLTDENLERILFDGNTSPTPSLKSSAKPSTPDAQCKHHKKSDGDELFTKYLSKNVLFSEPLHGCAFAGAVATTAQIGDSITVTHGPRSCAHIAARTIFSSGLRSLRTQREVSPEHLSPRILNSDMGEADMVYGGTLLLEKTVRAALKDNPKALFVVSTCPAGIIGDETKQLVETFGQDIQSKLIPVSSDGNLAGDYMQGMINACLEGAAALVDPTVLPDDKLVNIVAEKNIATNTDSNFHVVRGLLKPLGIGVNCRFVRRTTAEALRGLLKAPLNLLAHDDHFGRVLRDFLSDQFDAVFSEYSFPVGFYRTENWLRQIGDFFNMTAASNAVRERARVRYQSQLNDLRDHLAGKRLMIVTYNHDVDWILETALDLDMEVLKVCVLSSSQDSIFRTRYTGTVEVETHYPAERRTEDIEKLKPNLVLSNYVPRELPPITQYDAIPLCPDVGFESGTLLAKRWIRVLKAPLTEGWRRDVGLL